MLEYFPLSQKMPSVSEYGLVKCANEGAGWLVRKELVASGWACAEAQRAAALECYCIKAHTTEPSGAASKAQEQSGHPK